MLRHQAGNVSRANGSSTGKWLPSVKIVNFALPSIGPTKSGTAVGEPFEVEKSRSGPKAGHSTLAANAGPGRGSRRHTQLPAARLVHAPAKRVPSRQFARQKITSMLPAVSPPELVPAPHHRTQYRSICWQSPSPFPTSGCANRMALAWLTVSPDSALNSTVTIVLPGAFALRTTMTLGSSFTGTIHVPAMISVPLTTKADASRPLTRT